MKRWMAALLSLVLILTAQSNTVQAKGNDTRDVYEQQYTRIGEDYHILNDNVLLSKKDGSVWTWYIYGHPLSASDPFYEAKLMQIPGLQDVKEMTVKRKSARGNYIVNYAALKKDGTVWYWDAAPVTTLETSSASVPRQIKDLKNGTSLVAHYTGAYKVLFVLKSDGSVWSLGSEIGTTKGGSPTTVRTKLLDDVVSIKMANGIVFAVKKDGTVWRWKANSYLPNNRSKNTSPEQMNGFADIVKIEPGISTSYAYMKDGTVLSWSTADTNKHPLYLHAAKDARTMVQLDSIRDRNIDEAYALREDDQLWSVDNNHKVFPELTDIASIHHSDFSPPKRYYYVVKKDQTLWAWADSIALPKLVVFTGETATSNRPVKTDKPTAERPRTADKPTGNHPGATAQPVIRTTPEMSLYPYITMLQPGNKQFIAVNNLLPGTKMAYTIDDPSIGTLSNVNGTQVVKANKPGQTIVRATASRAGSPDVTASFLLYVVDSNTLSDTYYTAVRSVPVADRQRPFIVEGLTQAGELVITAASSEKPKLVDGQLVITSDLIDRVADNARKAKNAVEQTLSENNIALARELVVNGEILSLPDQNGFTIKLYKDSFTNRKDVDYLTVHAGDAKLTFNLATVNRLFHSLPVIVIRLVENNNGGYHVQFLDEQGQELSNVSSNIRLILPANQADATNNSVFYSNGKSTQPIGGKFNPYNNGMEAEINRSGTYFVDDNTKTFPDVDNRDPELQQAVQFLGSKGIVTGKEDGNFEPDSPLTRAEFTAMLVRAFYALDETATESFSDVNPPQWHVPFIASSEKKDIVKGYPDGTFRPDHTISREEMAAIGARSLHEKKNYYYPSNTEDYLNQFTDQQTISEWAKPTMALAVKQRLIDVPANKQIRAGEAVTRGEAARMLYRLYLQL
ncbi:S-layer protein [Brevibacillus sp. HB1.1]|uniref:S-layer homology domain-containing protein n=1 Tax=Brevibacillus sp. HB1.1 TaxID=2738808 RepID=UPI001575C420|nr:S-layer homology domain-containing protein [Brevibacillus sp. HB1.1]NTU31603.1 S-layer protein [Brevibacillus sp. HB1.1]